MKYELKQGDNAKTLKQYPDNYFDSIVTDPPYGIEFMAKAWDNNTGAVETWQECFRVLKPGGHILAFSASRTYHHLATNIESVGFEIRDQIMWLYGSGFPKSLNIGKAIDKRRSSNNVIRPWLKSLGSREELAKVAKVSPRQIDHYIGENTPCPQTLTYERFILICDYYKSYPEWSDDMFPKVGKKIGEKIHSRSGGEDFGKIVGSKSTTKTEDITESATDEAKQWEGWGTALKPAHEPIVMARKPLSENTVAENVLKHGTGGINIDESRVEYGSDQDKKHQSNIARGQENATNGKFFGGKGKSKASSNEPQGRFPANIIHDGSDEVLEGFPETKGRHGMTQHGSGTNTKYGKFARTEQSFVNDGVGDSGSAARFFYCPKASKKERNAGCGDMEGEVRFASTNESGKMLPSKLNEPHKVKGNYHPTVKPVALMKYLITLITPKGGKVLDPFNGSGSTGMACVELGYEYTGCELDPDYIEISKARIEAWYAENKPEEVNEYFDKI